jgi:betaine reductase
MDSERWCPHGEIMPEEEFYGFLKVCDPFHLVVLERDFTEVIRPSLGSHPDVDEQDLNSIGEGKSQDQLENLLAKPGEALPLRLRDGSLVGAIARAHDQDAVLTADVLLENLACKASATLALRSLLRSAEIEPASIQYLINTGEEAVGDRYQRGGGNLAKAIGEASGCHSATGSDVKGFCCGPVHGLMLAGGLIASEIYDRVAVVGGCSLAKLGMKFQGHLKHDMPILEDVLAAFAILVERDDGHSPHIRLDVIGRHTVDASSQQAIFRRLVSEPLQRIGLGFGDVGKYATELHNPEVTQPAGSGDVPLINYRVIAGLAALSGEIERTAMEVFVKTHGMPGFSPTQGHVASAIPFLPQGLDRLRSGELERIMFLAKGSLFLGRMTQLSDGISLMVERNRA